MLKRFEICGVIAGGDNTSPTGLGKALIGGRGEDCRGLSLKLAGNFNLRGDTKEPPLACEFVCGGIFP